MRIKRDSYAYLSVRSRIIREIEACGETCVGDIICLVDDAQGLAGAGLSGKGLHRVVHMVFEDLVKLRRIECVVSWKGRPRSQYYKFANVLERIVVAISDDIEVELL